jgi:hypothetical protein
MMVVNFVCAFAVIIRPWSLFEAELQEIIYRDIFVKANATMVHLGSMLKIIRNSKDC